MVFENDVFLFAGHEEGRLRKAASGVVAYDYFIKDHLGNTRMVLTDETNTQYYPTLSSEGGSGSGEANNQNAIWDDAAGNSIDIVNRRVNRPGNFGTTGTNGNYAFSITKNGGSIGAGKLLKVMSGDNIYSSVDYFYHNNYADNSSANGLGSILNHIAGVIAGTRSPAGTAVKTANNAAAGSLGADGLFTGVFAPQSPSGGYTYQPKAYMHILLFDEQFKFDAANSYVVQVSAWVQESRQTLYGSASAKKNGYAYIYFSNESNDVVFFDNFNLTHQAGPLLEETHYYPFGLTMGGVSSKAAGRLENKYKFGDKEMQNREFTDGSGLEMYDFGKRNYDQQIGRWWQIDPMSEARNWVTPFNYVQNNPITRIDPDGAFDDYYIRDNGEISVKKTDDSFDKFYTQKSERTEGDMVIRTYKFEAKLDKNEDGLIALPNSFQGDGFGFNYTGSKGENYISGSAFAGLIGALKEAQVSDVSLNHWSNADGSSPSPSRSHKNGEVGDIRPLRKDESGSPVLITDKQFDAERNGTLMKSMKKFGWTSILSEKNPSTGQITPGTTHYSGYTDKNGNWKSVRHNNHYHAQRFHPKLIPYKPYKP
ncbi:RHS repeat-associated core domain-containing protein [Sediminibacterium sp. C3]|uniref:RHS repeat-associated core domain-containing protein n=1 Tax=Sediminibacterium sp. C3 TaxID=1267211 RepID=UPI000407E5D0|nr:RHS repeat-associated core domain-containing protein [Sediminibacterium sp. C3]